MLKYLIIAMIGLTTLMSCNQGSKDKPAKKPLSDSYTLPIPAGWGTELFLIPINFAPEIPYKGVEDVRFAPGWGKSGSNEYWTYAFLWCLENNPKTDAKIIENNLKAYYTGLVGSNIQKYNIPRDKIIETEIFIEKAKTVNGDVETFKGTIRMLDYMLQEPITLNCVVHLKSCSNQNTMFIFHEISPKPFTDSVWKNLNQIWAGFECNDNNMEK